MERRPTPDRSWPSAVLSRLPSLCRLCGGWRHGPVCADCTQVVTRARPRCGRCALALTPAQAMPGRCTDRCPDCDTRPPAFDHALAAMDYDGPIPALLGALKFKGDAPLARWMAQQMAGKARERWQTADPGTHAWRRGAPTLLLPMPISGQRLRERGFNQTLGLTRLLAQSLHLPIAPSVLTRPRHTQRLMRLSADERPHAIAGAFALTPEGRGLVAGRHVALIDDVLTTGATAAEAARLLWRAGAREVSVWVVARTPAPAPGRFRDAALQHDVGNRPLQQVFG